MDGRPVAADAVLFDFDGCLVDSRAAFADSLNAALAEHGLAVHEPAALHPYLGPPLHGTVRMLLAGTDAGEVEADALVASYRRHLREIGPRLTVAFDGVAEMLARLAAVVPLVVATSKPRALAEPLLVGLGLREHFLAVHGPGLEARDETKAETIGRALGDLPGARSPVMVGDRHHDVDGAREHGLSCIGVLWGIGGEQELRDAGAVALARHPGELPGLLGVG